MGWAFGVLIGFLVLLLISSLAVFLRTALLHLDQLEREHRDNIRRIAEAQGGAVTATEVASQLGIRLASADRILRGMVDDEQFKMGVDDETSLLKFWYPEITKTGVVGHVSRYSRVRRSGTGDLEVHS